MDKTFTYLLLAIYGFCLSSFFSPFCLAGDAQPPASPKTANTVSWTNAPSPQKLRVHLGEGLTAKQLATLNSGFSTFSRLLISAPMNITKDILISTSCTVKYDMWEERYQVIVLSEPPTTKTVKDFTEYTLLCLNAEITDPTVISKLKTEGGYLLATLQIEQISPTQAQKIKSWLINQQSAVMRGLFSHMLGEFTLTQTSEIKLQVPPL